MDMILSVVQYFIELGAAGRDSAPDCYLRHYNFTRHADKPHSQDRHL